MLRNSPAQEDVPADFGRLIRIGRIGQVDLAAGTCTVTFGDPDSDDGEVESASVRWAAPRAGQTRIWLPPSPGEQVVFLCPEGELGLAVPIASLWSADHPTNGDSQRHLATFADGAEIAYDPEAHHLDLKLPVGATLAIEADGGVTIKGDVAIEGDVTVTGTLTASDDVVGGGKSLKTHKHTGVQAGAAQTGAPA